MTTISSDSRQVSGATGFYAAVIEVPCRKCQRPHILYSEPNVWQHIICECGWMAIFTVS